MYKDMELRKLPPGPLCRIADILETNSDWKKVMSRIPKNLLDKDSGPKYTNEHMRLIEEYAKTTNKKCAEILFDEWGTSGRVRPTLGTLRDIIIEARMFRAADEIADILKEPRPSRPGYGPFADIDTGVTNLLQETREQNHNDLDTDLKKNFSAINNDPTAQMMSSENNIPVFLESYDKKSTAQIPMSDRDLIKFSNSESMLIPNFDAMDINSTPVYSTVSIVSDSSTGIMPAVNPVLVPDTKIDTTILKNASLAHFEYKLLESITNKFSEKCKIGSGGFGEVYIGCHKRFGNLAVKRFRQNLMSEHKPDIGIRVFNSEVKCLSQLRHKNIVPIIGYSIGPSLCVVCEFIDGGSLEQRLAGRGERGRLDEAQRLAIIVGTAEGLKYIHQSEKPFESDGAATSDPVSLKKNNFLHGDVKSANILLTNDCVPKLCDFGLAKHIDYTTILTASPMGTSAYMAPEGFHGTITQKMDIFSYGMVLLEILTGKPIVIVEGNQRINIKDYVADNCVNGDITSLLDPTVGVWTKADQVYELAKNCLQMNRNSRPSIDIVCEELQKIADE